MLTKIIGVLLGAASANAASLEATSANTASYLPNIDVMFYHDREWNFNGNVDLINMQDVDRAEWEVGRCTVRCMTPVTGQMYGHFN